MNNRLCWLIVGLGNPGRQYERTPHNVGFHVLDELAERQAVSFQKPVFSQHLLSSFRLDGHRFYLCKPLCYVNRSGSVLPALMRKTGARAGNVIVVLDNVDLPQASLRLKRGTGKTSHNGLRSINTVLPPTEYHCLYVGVGKDKSRDLASYVLAPWSDEADTQYGAAFERAAEHLEQCGRESLQTIMNTLNGRKK